MSAASGPRFAAGIALLTVTVVLWGLTFPIAKPAVVAIDVWWLAAIRYLSVPLIFAALLLVFEGRAAFDYEGRFRPAAIFGTIGFVGYNVCTFLGLRTTSPEHAALISSTQSVLVALVVWLWYRRRPPAYTLVAIVAAAIGLALVVTRGEPLAALGGGRLAGDALVLVGASSWVVYILAVPKFPQWSALRFTTLTCIPGGVATVAIALVATALGAAEVPPAADLAGHAFEIVYLIVATAVIGVLTWNAGIARLGPVNATLFGTLVPVVTFVARAAGGERYGIAELGGAALVIAALLGNNLAARRVSRAGRK